MPLNICLEQISVSLNKENNIQIHIDKIKQAINQKLNIIAFPELSLNGYLVQDLTQEDYFTIDAFQEFKLLSKQIDVIFGCIYKNNTGQIYNSAIYIHNQVLHIHNKNSLPNYGMFEESRFFKKSNNFDSFEINNKKIVLAICEDVWYQTNINKIKNLNVDILYILASSPARGFYKTLDIQKKWYDILDEISKIIPSIVFINRVGVEDGITFWGGSKIIQTTTTSILPLFEEHSKVISI